MDGKMYSNARYNCRYLRLKQEKSEREMADLLGVSPTWVCRFETCCGYADATDDRMKQIAKILGVKLLDLVSAPPTKIFELYPWDIRHGIKELARIRKEKGMTKTEFSRFLGFTDTYMSKIEHGYTKPKITSWWTMSEKLGIPLEQLIGRETKCK